MSVSLVLTVHYYTPSIRNGQARLVHGMHVGRVLEWNPWTCSRASKAVKFVAGAVGSREQGGVAAHLEQERVAGLHALTGGDAGAGGAEDAHRDPHRVAPEPGRADRVKGARRDRDRSSRYSRRPRAFRLGVFLVNPFSLGLYPIPVGSPRCGFFLALT